MRQASLPKRAASAMKLRRANEEPSAEKSPNTKKSPKFRKITKVQKLIVVISLVNEALEIYIV